MKKIGFILLTSLIILSGCSKKTATSENNLDGVDIYKYNSEIAKVVSLSSGFKESELINSTDMNKLKEIYEKNDSSVNQTSIDITDDIKKFTSDLGTAILAKYNYKNYRYEFDGGEFSSGEISDGNRLTDSDREIALKLYKDIESLWAEYDSAENITEDMLQKVYDTCERYRALSIPQKGLISNIVKLGNMVENYEGSVDTNFNLEFWKWNIKKLVGEPVDDYSGPSDSDLGIVQGRLMYGENPDGTPYTPIKVDSSYTAPSTFDNNYDKNSASYDDYYTELEIPIDYYECVVDNGSEGTNYVSDDKLLNKIAGLDSRLYTENNKLYLKVDGNTSSIKLLNWGSIIYYAPENKYREYDIKDYVYWDDGKFKLGLESLDKVDYRILTGSIKDKVIYFTNIEDAIPKFASLHIDVVKELGKQEVNPDMKSVYEERETSHDSSNIETPELNEDEGETRAGTFNDN